MLQWPRSPRSQPTNRASASQHQDGRSSSHRVAGRVSRSGARATSCFLLCLPSVPLSQNLTSRYHRAHAGLGRLGSHLVTPGGRLLQLDTEKLRANSPDAVIEHCFESQDNAPIGTPCDALVAGTIGWCRLPSSDLPLVKPQSPKGPGQDGITELCAAGGCMPPEHAITALPGA
jgi:hypothetical protein